MSDTPEPRLSKQITRANDARRPKYAGSPGASHITSRLLNQLVMNRIVGGPSPNTW